jgi:dethiobiotin synthetase
MGILFITGSGTGVGKTYVASALIQQLRRSSRQVLAFKPVATGMVPMDDPAFADTDTARLIAAQGLPIDVASIAACTPWRFALPLSPDMAAAAEGRTLHFVTIVDWARAALSQAACETLVLIEGVGGVMSPIAADALNIDLIAAVGCPALLVGGTYLGAINHTLMAIEALQARKIALQALVLSETRGSSVDIVATLGSLSRFAAGVRITPIRHGENISDQLAFELARSNFANK